MVVLCKVCFFSCAIASLLLTVQPTVALCQTDIPAAREAYQRATAEFGLGNYGSAAAEYEKAFRYKPDPALLFNAAQAYRLADNKPRAIQLYRNYLRLFSTGVAASEARKHVDTLQNATPATPKGPVVTAGDAPKAEVPIAPAAPEARKADLTLSQEASAHEDRAVLRNPWFWAGAAAVAIAVTALVIVASTDSDPGNPDATWGRVTVK
ncbi:MAG: hypothetical protein SGI86_03500 [Deltaproteobacteria bacterium]|nr:hypothetical protein [Deltaproteobacteria bacterium]